MTFLPLNHYDRHGGFTQGGMNQGVSVMQTIYARRPDCPHRRWETPDFVFRDSTKLWKLYSNEVSLSHWPAKQFTILVLLVSNESNVSNVVDICSPKILLSL